MILLDIQCSMFNVYMVCTHRILLTIKFLRLDSSYSHKKNKGHLRGRTFN